MPDKTVEVVETTAGPSDLRAEPGRIKGRSGDMRK